MPVYTYLVADLMTNTILGELPLTSVTFSQVLNGAGAFSGELHMGDPRIKAAAVTNMTIPGRTALYVDRDGVLVWGGIIWTRAYDDATRVLTITGNEFWSYFRRRLISSDTIWPSPSDPLVMVRQIIGTAQNMPYGNIGVQIGTETSATVQSFGVHGYDLKPAGEAVEEMSVLGFDFGIDVQYDSTGRPAKTLHLACPRRGRNATATGLMFEKPGNIAAYTWPDDATEQATAVYAQGSGDGVAMIRSTTSAPELLAAGWPLLETGVAYKDISVQTQLDGHARADMRKRRYVMTIPKLTVRADLDPVLGSYITGDECRIRITDEYQSVDTYRRILLIEVTPPEDRTPESVDLTMGEALDQ
ncbi:hypothetical protein GCM10009760_26000 [Kitasatospora kazusensis]|uniref:Minor tail protein n=1 Tax=Kitasatospora kazusensis TaxID=407974 RepID=A0ABN2ZFZ2_9ACTN